MFGQSFKSIKGYSRGFPAVFVFIFCHFGTIARYSGGADQQRFSSQSAMWLGRFLQPCLDRRALKGYIDPSRFYDRTSPLQCPLLSQFTNLAKERSSRSVVWRLHRIRCSLCTLLWRELNYAPGLCPR